MSYAVTVIFTVLVLNCLGYISTEETSLMRSKSTGTHYKLHTLHSLASQYLKHASKFSTTVDFTVPLFSFKFPLGDQNSSTAIIQQNLIGQLIYFFITAISFIASISVPYVINKVKQNEDTPKLQLEIDYCNKKYHNHYLWQLLCEINENVVKHNRIPTAWPET